MIKKNLILIFLLPVTIVSAQLKIDQEDFSAKFKLLFTAAEKRFINEKAGEIKSIDENNFKASYNVAATFKDAISSRLLIDKDDLLVYEAVFKAAASKDDAKKILEEFITLVRSNLPSGFIINKTYEMDWADIEVYSVDFDSDVFAIQSKHPSLRIGLVGKEGEYFIRMLIYEPVFKS